ncbi:hypothetical protein ADICYQ_1904 [Cyclobacterium qasimii M12-11B]|uniref:Uncharacterized protein n=1 Tax=Cyclobacterium qasimii M12-11B TaxID=641524 RepID=S7VHX7_9BACT|nr:hypothetical protein ADICYQ_1904 [Cyclobacterium qasimii M12-11B]
MVNLLSAKWKSLLVFELASNTAISAETIKIEIITIYK